MYESSWEEVQRYKQHVGCRAWSNYKAEYLHEFRLSLAYCSRCTGLCSAKNYSGSGNGYPIRVGPRQRRVGLVFCYNCFSPTGGLRKSDFFSLPPEELFTRVLANDLRRLVPGKVDSTIWAERNSLFRRSVPYDDLIAMEQLQHQIPAARLLRNGRINPETIDAYDRWFKYPCCLEVDIKSHPDCVWRPDSGFKWRTDNFNWYVRRGTIHGLRRERVYAGYEYPTLESAEAAALAWINEIELLADNPPTLIVAEAPPEKPYYRRWRGYYHYYEKTEHELAHLREGREVLFTTGYLPQE